MTRAHAVHLLAIGLRTAALAVLLFVVWCALSGKSELRFLVLGGLCAVLAAVCATLLPARAAYIRAFSLRGAVVFPFYLLWLSGQIISANLHVAGALLSPKLKKVTPRTLFIAPRQEHDVLRALFANSITLTPGTVTVETFDDLFLVHALTEQTADMESLDAMNRRIAHLEYREMPEGRGQ